MAGSILRSIFGGVYLAAASCIADAQSLPPANPLIQSYGIAEYGGNLQNWAIEQGPDGLIYVGGGSSLLVFDGAVWKNISTPQNSRVRDLKIDEDGRIWVGMPGDFGYFERDARGTLAYVSIADRLPEAERDFGETRHLWLLEDTVYFNTLERLYRWRNNELVGFDAWDGVIRTTFLAHGRYFAVVGDRIFDLTEFPDSGSVPIAEERWRWPSGLRVTSFLAMPDDSLLVSTYDDGLYVLTSGELAKFSPDSGLESVWPYKLLRLSGGDILVTTIHGGAVRLAPDGEMVEWFDRRYGLPANTTLGATEDHQGGLWLAQEGFLSRVATESSVRGLADGNGVNNVRGITELGGEIYVAGIGGVSILRIDENGVTQAVPVEVDPIQEAFDVLAVDEGLLISGFRGVYLAQIDAENLQATNIERLFEDNYSYQLFASPDGSTVYAEGERGLGVLRKTGDGWRLIENIPDIGVRPSTVLETSDGTVWIGSDIGALYRLRWTDNQTLQWIDTIDAEDGVPEGNALVFEIGDRLIFGTTEGGYRLRADGETVEPGPFFSNDQLGQNREVFRLYSPDDEHILAVLGGQSDMWQGRVTATGIEWQGPILRELNAGTTGFFSELRGVTWFNRPPALYRMDWPNDRETIQPSMLHLRRVWFPDRDDRALLDGVAPMQRHDSPLEPTADTLRFEYALASYTRPDQTEYRTRLSGLEDDWSRWTQESRRDVTNLGGGDYTLEVQARDVSGRIFESRPWAFRVSPAWYWGPAAWTAYLLAGLLLLWLAARWGQHRRQLQMEANQKRLEREVAERTREVRDQAREIRKLSDARARFFANVSHEFRTPLTLAKAPLEDLVRGTVGSLDDQARTLARIALRNTEAMQGLIGQILDLQRLEADRMPISAARDDFSQLVGGVVDDHVELARRGHVTLSLDTPEEPVTADFDAGHMKKVIGNLLSNAIKFSPENSEVRVRVSSTEEHVLLEVVDAGPGVAAEDRERIFERYAQGDQTHASSPGTGIGLSLVRDLVGLHRGRAWVESEAGRGSTFCVQFPARLPDLLRGPVAEEMPIEGMPDTEEIESAVSPETAEDVPRILIVDDNEELREFLRLRLSASYAILEAEDGEAGLAMAREALPDVIVTDVMMPRMSGLEMTAALKADPETDFIPVLMLSARTTRRDTVDGLTQGADDYLAKPFDTAELSARLAALLAARRRLEARLAPTESESGESEPDSGFLARARAILAENLGDGDFGPVQWAERLHMDRTTLYRRIKAETDLAPADFLREQRLEAARRMLAQREGNVSQVAVATGFNSISYFSRRFRERFGITPAQARGKG